MSQNLDYEILDLGLVIYKGIVKDPDKIIKDILDLDNRFTSNEHGSQRTVVKAWTPWEYGENKFCDMKYLLEEEHIPEKDYYAKEQISIYQRLESGLQSALDHYSKVLYPFAEKNIKGRESQFHILRYASDGYLPAHQDQGISSRVLSVVTYLNDDYEGGEIEFVNSNVKIKPPAGSIIFFPSNFLYVHEVHKMTSGQRYALPYWFHNREIIVESDGRE
jgi:Rps23 Pro-64 3,4-dihydroxylase Tpa1-like proline 4-hydroxylase